MPSELFGIVIAGVPDDVRRSYDKWRRQPVDWELSEQPVDLPQGRQTTIGRTVYVTGPGTFFSREHRTLIFEPTSRKGWWFDRMDLPNALQIRVSVRNVWTSRRNIVLRSGSPHNYMRMAEHVIALKEGLGIDNLLIRVNSGDPPLFDRGSLDLVEALESAGIVPQESPCVFVTVKEPVTVGGPRGSFLTFLPYQSGAPRLHIDCAIDFPDAIGKQRVRFNLSSKIFQCGSLARTNTTVGMKLFCRTIGKLFADIRNLGYTDRNILIAGRKRYLNEPHLMHGDKSLEAVWHRALLDLLSAVSLIERGRFAGKIISYKSGHTLDIEMIRLLYKYDILKTVSLLVDTN